MGLVLLP